ncbi:Type I transmembrane sorting receptor [Ascosphaera atra]|nr:Type I transmembrane sorting receptor [Ascosphaera atra]
MYFNFNGVVSALTLAATLSNAASIPRSTKGAFSVTQVPFARNASSVFEHWTATLKKHKGRIPTYEKSNGGNEQGSAKVTPIGGDEEYLVPVTIGGDTLNLDLDTGSSDLWVFSSQAPQSEVGQHNTYKPGNSSKKLPNSSWEISYVDGSGASGNVYTDEVSIAGVSVKNQGVEAATQVSSSFTEDTQNDGLIGMAFSKLNTGEYRYQPFSIQAAHG